MRTDGRTDGQTDMTKLVVVIRNFANVPRNAVRFEEINARNNDLPVTDTKRNNHLQIL
jgi:hypothetical protein